MGMLLPFTTPPERLRLLILCSAVGITRLYILVKTYFLRKLRNVRFRFIFLNIRVFLIFGIHFDFKLPN